MANSMWMTSVGGADEEWLRRFGTMHVVRGRKFVVPHFKRASRNPLLFIRMDIDDADLLAMFDANQTTLEHPDS